MSRVLFVTLIPVVASISVAASSLAASSKAGKTGTPGAAQQKSSSGIKIAEWFALGSGCKAKNDLPGDVTMEFLGADKEDPSSYTMRFHLPKYALDGAAPINPGRPTFARECALRLSVTLPEKSRVKLVLADSKIVFSKGKEVKLQLASQLHLGAQVVASDIRVHEAGKEVKGAEQLVALVAGAGQKNPIPEQICGSPKIIGLDFSFTNWRTDSKAEVYATLDGKKFVDLKVKLEPCIPLPQTPSPGVSSPSALPTASPTPGK